jgi:hypothetical protein
MTLILSCPLPQKTLAARLKRGIADSFRLSHGSTPYKSTKSIAGEVYKWPHNSVRFFIFKRRLIFGSLAPRLEGWISTTDEGSEIEAMLDVRHLLFEILLFKGFFAFCILLIFRSLLDPLSQGWTIALLVAAGAFLIGVVIQGWHDIQYLQQFLVKFVDEISQASEEKLKAALQRSSKD